MGNTLNNTYPGFVYIDIRMNHNREGYGLYVPFQPGRCG